MRNIILIHITIILFSFKCFSQNETINELDSLSYDNVKINGVNLFFNADNIIRYFGPLDHYQYNIEKKTKIPLHKLDTINNISFGYSEKMSLYEQNGIAYTYSINTQKITIKIKVRGKLYKIPKYCKIDFFKEKFQNSYKNKTIDNSIVTLKIKIYKKNYQSYLNFIFENNLLNSITFDD